MTDSGEALETTFPEARRKLPGLHQRSTRLRRFTFISAIVGTIALGAGWLAFQAEPSEQILTKAYQSLQRGEIVEAERLASLLLDVEPNNPDARLLLAEIRLAQAEPGLAIQELSLVPKSSLRQYQMAQALAGDIYFYELKQAGLADRAYQQALLIAPRSTAIHRQYAILKSICGRWWEQIPHQLRVVQANQHDLTTLLSLALADRSLANPMLADALHTASPDDPLGMLAAARLALERQEIDQATQLLRTAIELDADLIQARVRLGKLLFEQNSIAEFEQWITDLPPSADSHPDTWILKGHHELNADSPLTALRCFCEAILREPNSADALMQAGQILRQLSLDSTAERYMERARLLQEFQNAVQAVNAADSFENRLLAANLAERLGNLWEALGWTQLAAKHPDALTSTIEDVTRLQEVTADLPLERTAPQHNPARHLRLADYPLPNRSVDNLVTNEVVSPFGTVRTARFSEQAQSAGLVFRFHNGSHDIDEGIQYMFEVLGGGIGVVDLNMDLYPDLYLPQGSRWPPRESQTELVDQIFLNRGDGRFLDVTDRCGIAETSFSQGVAVGDYDSDGFPDLLIGNIGRNRLLLNNGDGTFSDSSDLAGLNDDQWTSSVAIADLTGDGHPDLYVVNYLEAEDLFERLCGPGKNRACLPQLFRAAQDRLLVSQADGRFADGTRLSGLTNDHGKGLGLVIGSFSHPHKLDVFVANDTVANNFFRNECSDDGSRHAFRDSALLNGLAMNGAGQTEACMGVAVADADEDGQQDLFITNFHGETNTFYKQMSPGLFEDQTRIRGLSQPSIAKLGFGAQFLDANLDGRWDLFVANGHIDNYSSDGQTEYRMQPQLFLNAGAVGFVEAESSTLGQFFETRRLGRSVARLDFNHDGREDLVVQHLDAPIALLENTTPHSGHFVSLRLIGTSSSRDAIGTTVQLRLKHRTITRQLLAGDGFMASNQRVINLRWLVEEAVETLEVKWISGTTEVFDHIPPDAHCILVEGSGRLMRVESH